MEIPLFKVFMSDAVQNRVNRVLSSGFVGQGDEVEEFESILRSYFGNTYLNTLNSGTSALHLALRLLASRNGKDGILPGDEVLTIPITCTATNVPILANGYRIKWVDTDPRTCNVDTDDLLRKISPTTKAIVVVHWSGYPCDLDKLKLAQNKCKELYGFYPPIIEDCAHAWGASYKNKLLGNHGNICMFSFQAIKHLTTVDGGLLVLPNDDLHRRAKLMRWYGLDRTSSADFRCQQDIEEWGYKFHMNDLNAAIGICNFQRSFDIVQRHRENANFYNEQLADITGITLLENSPDRQASYWVYTMHVDNRDDFVKMMKEKGIATSRVHDRNDKHPCFKDFKCALPNTDKVCKTMISIPCGWWVSDDDRNNIVNYIKSGW